MNQSSSRETIARPTVIPYQKASFQVGTLLSTPDFQPGLSMIMALIAR